MSGSRQDAWTSEEDGILAETVLTYIKNGNTQLDAFKEVADQLKRTPAACGFRWNANIRKLYETEVENAKRERKGIEHRPQEAENDPLEKAISLLEHIKYAKSFGEQGVKDQITETERLEAENKTLKRQVENYQQAWKQIEAIWQQAALKLEEEHQN